MDDLYYELYLESLKKIKKFEKELEPQLAPLKSQIDDFNKKIKIAEGELKEIEKQKKLCRQKKADIKNAYTKDIIAYMREKIRDERTGQKQIVQIDDDRKIVEFDKKKNDILLNQEELLKKYDEQVATKKATISQLKSELQPIKEKRDRIAKPLDEEKDARDKWHYAYKRSIVETTSLDSEDIFDTSSSYSPSSSSNSYEEDRYAREQAEELKKQTDYARQQAEEARKQTELAKRQMEESRRQAQRAEHEARERRLEEDRRRRQQQEAERREMQRQKEEALRRERNRRYHGVIYFKGGRTQTTGSSNDRRAAERMAQQMYDQAMRTAISDHFKPTRYEVVED